MFDKLNVYVFIDGDLMKRRSVRKRNMYLFFCLYNAENETFDSYRHFKLKTPKIGVFFHTEKKNYRVLVSQ